MASLSSTIRNELMLQQLLACRFRIREICGAAFFEDVFQDVAVRCAKKIELDWTNRHHRLILKIAHDCYVDQVRRLKRYHTVSIDDANMVAAECREVGEAPADSKLRILRAVLECLGTPLRRVLLKEKSDLSLASEYGVTVWAIQQWRSRAIRWIRREIANFSCSA